MAPAVTKQLYNLAPQTTTPNTTNMSAEFWNDRYAAEDLVYGDAPNEFLSSVADQLHKSGPK